MPDLKIYIYKNEEIFKYLRKIYLFAKNFVQRSEQIKCER